MQGPKLYPYYSSRNLPKKMTGCGYCSRVRVFRYGSVDRKPRRGTKTGNKYGEPKRGTKTEKKGGEPKLRIKTKNGKIE